MKVTVNGREYVEALWAGQTTDHDDDLLHLVCDGGFPRCDKAKRIGVLATLKTLDRLGISRPCSRCFPKGDR